MTVKIDDFKKNRSVSDIKISDDKKTVCFMLSEVNMEKNRYERSIYALIDNKIKRISSKGVRFFTFYDDENLMIIADDAEEKDSYVSSVYKLPLYGGERELMFKIKEKLISVERIKDDKYLIKWHFDRKYKDRRFWSEEEKAKKEKELKEEEDSFISIDEIPFFFNEKGYTNKKRIKLSVYDAKKDSISDISDDYTSVGMTDFDKDKKRVLFIASSYMDKKSSFLKLYIYDVERDELRKIEPIDDLSYDVAYFSEKGIYVLGSDQKKYGVNENLKIYIYDEDKETLKCINESLDCSFGSSVGSDLKTGAGYYVKEDKNKLYFISTDEYSSNLYVTDYDGNIEKLTKDIGSIDCFDVKDGDIYFSGFRDYKLSELYKLENCEEKVLSSFNDELLKEWNVKPPVQIEFENDKVKFKGFVQYPYNYEKGRKYPALLEIHGGPKTVYGNVLFHELQYFASEGFFVFYTNPRGGDGRGNEFMDIRGKYGSVDYDDLMKFTDTVLEKFSDIDKDKVSVTGGSYGGFMTNWIIGHTDRFRNAVSQRSISNWISFFGTTDIGYYFASDQSGATPFDDVNKLWDLSPLKYAPNVSTRTLFIHSDEDYRCALGQAQEIFTALKYFGVDSKMTIFRGENHNLSRNGKPKSRLRRLKEIIEWIKY